MICLDRGFIPSGSDGKMAISFSSQLNKTRLESHSKGNHYSELHYLLLTFGVVK